MYLYNNDGGIQHYKSPEEIMEEFYTIRLGVYQKRKEYLLQKLMRECIVLENKVKFVQSVLDEKIKWNQSEDIIEQRLQELTINRLDLDEFNLGIDLNTRVPLPDAKVSYHYVLDMKIRSLTKEKVEALQKDYDQKRVEYDLLGAKKITDMWLDDLSALQKVYTFDSVSPIVTIAKAVPVVPVVTKEAPKKKLLIKKKPVTMDKFFSSKETTLAAEKVAGQFIVEKDIDSDDSENVSLAVVKKKLIRKVITKDE
jgi:DNA topoisomerase-2